LSGGSAPRPNCPGGGTLAGQTALITGAASGIGRASALMLRREGANIIAVDQNSEGLATLAKETGAHVIHADLTDRLAIKRAVTEARRLSDGIDILVNAAGITAASASLLETTDEDWDRVHAVNSTAPFLLIREVGKQMVERGKGGRIVNITSSSAHRAKSSKPAYGSSKAALAQLTRIAAAELGAHDINVNAIAPGLTRTPIVDRAYTPEQLAAALASGPIANLLNRISEPDDIAATVLFLCQPGSRQITGQTLHVSAGAIV